MWQTFVFVAIWLVGTVATFVPVLPATLIVWLGALVYALLTGFQEITVWWLLGLGIVALATSFVDNIAAAVGAGRFGGSRAAGWGALVGSIIGIFLGPLGILIGPMAGAVVAELITGRPFDQAVRAAWGTVLGLAASVVVKFMIHLLMGIAVLWRIAQ
ncbi:hypothetical protein HNR42_003097 [Deinobacterium chartae]|uniref:DUF456 domain-containing protein n=1 Tax=Deinobacterium chartae TaxID=521158 RepID=A0A841I3M8_9DEIO|nr:hypothetical protein [Deinobacterium chartae]